LLHKSTSYSYSWQQKQINFQNLQYFPNFGFSNGNVISYDRKYRWYKIEYDDGDIEDVSEGEMDRIAFVDESKKQDNDVEVDDHADHDGEVDENKDEMQPKMDTDDDVIFLSEEGSNVVDAAASDESKIDAAAAASIAVNEISDNGAIGVDVDVARLTDNFVASQADDHVDVADVNQGADKDVDVILRNDNDLELTSTNDPEAVNDSMDDVAPNTVEDA
jgi:hypothetical protein